MRKFTIIILLWSTFSTSTIQLSAQNADIDILKSINNNTSTVGFSKIISNSTTTVAISIPVVMGIVACIEKDDDLMKNAIYVGAGLGIDAALTYGLKKAVDRPRPAVTYPDLITPYENRRSLSFPSGHTSFAFAAATSLSLKIPKWYIIAPSYLWACSVGYSRMNLGVHYPSDVLCGALAGAGSAFLTYKLNNWFWKKQGNKLLINAWKNIPMKE